MKKVINSLFLVGMLLQTGYSVAGGAPVEGYWSRFRKAIAVRWKGTGLVPKNLPYAAVPTALGGLAMYTGSEVGITGGMAEAVAGGYLALKGFKEDSIANYILGNILLTVGGITAFEPIGTSDKNESVLAGLAVALGTTTTILGVTAMVGKRLHNYYQTHVITKLQWVDAQKKVYSTVLSTLPELPTMQMKLNEVIRLMVILEQEKQSEENRVKIEALQQLKTEMENSPVLKKIREIQAECGGGVCIPESGVLDKYKNSDDPIIKQAVRELSIDYYLHKASQGVIVYTNSDEFNKLVQEEKKLRQNLELIVKSLASLENDSKYQAAKALESNKSIKLLQYEKEYAEVRGYTEKQKKWMQSIKGSPGFSQELVDQAIYNVEYRELKKKYLDAGALKQQMDSMVGIKHRAAGVLLQEMEAKAKK